MKKGQMDYPIITFVGIVIALLILTPVFLKFSNEILNPYEAGVGNQSAVAGANVRYIHTTFIAFWDWIMIIAFLVSVILLLASAFFIDTHPFFLVLYIIFNLIMIVFAPNFIEAVDGIWDSAAFLTEATQAPMMDFIRQNFMIVILGVMIIAGVILYGKLKYISTSSGGQQY